MHGTSGLSSTPAGYMVPMHAVGMDGGYAGHPYMYGGGGYYPGDDALYYDGDGSGYSFHPHAVPGPPGAHMPGVVMHGYHPSQVGMGMAAGGYGSWIDPRGAMAPPGSLPAQHAAGHDGGASAAHAVPWYHNDLEFTPQSQGAHARQFAQSLGTSARCHRRQLPRFKILSA
jgi:hypothetical protein